VHEEPAASTPLARWSPSHTSDALVAGDGCLAGRKMLVRTCGSANAIGLYVYYSATFLEVQMLSHMYITICIMHNRLTRPTSIMFNLTTTHLAISLATKWLW
jgi:hypothetical protein